MLFDFDDFERDFQAACLDGIRFLARRYNTAQFYAVCVYVDGFDGAFGLYANTEEEFHRTLQAHLAEYPEFYTEPLEVKSLKYNCGDWAYQSFGPPDDFADCMSSRIQAWSSPVYDLSYKQNALTIEHYQLFEEIACRIALSNEMAQELATLRRTDDFLVTVSGHDEPELASIYRPLWYTDKVSLDGFEPMAYSAHD